MKSEMEELRAGNESDVSSAQGGSGEGGEGTQG
jgi:hypothetical protein